MYRRRRRPGRPPQVVRLPCSTPLSRLSVASPTTPRPLGACIRPTRPAVVVGLGWTLDGGAPRQIDQIIRDTIKDPVGPEFMAPPARTRPIAQGARDDSAMA
jgi:hypothetical protein